MPRVRITGSTAPILGVFAYLAHLAACDAGSGGQLPNGVLDTAGGRGRGDSGAAPVSTGEEPGADPPPDAGAETRAAARPDAPDSGSAADSGSAPDSGSTADSGSAPDSGVLLGSAPDEPCGPFDPAKVYVTGLMKGGGASDRFVDVAFPHRSCMSLGSDVTHGAIIRPSDGRILFVRAPDMFVFTPDAMTWTNGMWTEPVNPEANDVSLGPAPCPQPEGPYRAYAFPDTSELAYRCEKAFFTTSGRALGEAVVGWGTNGRILRAIYPSTDHLTTGFDIVDAVGGRVEFRQTELTGKYVATARSHADGFHVVLTRGAQQPRESWLLRYDGQLVARGIFATAPAPVSTNQGLFVAIDAAGSLYEVRAVYQPNRDDRDVVVRASLEPGTAEIVYDPGVANGTANPVTNRNLRVLPVVTWGEYFITGP